MCIGFIKIGNSPDDRYKLILLNNRDEVLDRPTKEMHWHDDILSGVDEQDASRGTWLGINKSGKIGMLLSITQPPNTKHITAPSRGAIVHKFLDADSSEFFEELLLDAENYNGFQFLAIEQSENSSYGVKTVTNQLVDKLEVREWEDSEHLVFSNSPSNIPFKKVIRGQEIFPKALENSNELEVDTIIEKLLEVATDRTRCFPDEQIRVQTSLPHELNAPLTSIFIRFPEERRYGTRCHTIIIIDQNDTVTVFERRMLASEKVEESPWVDQKFEFKLSK